MGEQVIGTPAKMALIALMSFVVMISSSKHCDDQNSCTKEAAWGVACSVISLVLSFALLAAWKLGRLEEPVLPIADKGNLVTSLFFLAWWSAGAGVLTFHKPFTVPSNGYFATWAAFLASASMASALVPQVEGALTSLGQSGPDLTYVLFASIVLFFQGISDVSTNKGNDKWKSKGAMKANDSYYVAAIILGLVSALLAVAGIFLRNKIEGPIRAVYTGVLCTLWGTTWFIFTFFDPYVIIGNGYLATCAGFIFAMKILAQYLGLVAYVEAYVGGDGASSRPPQATNPVSSLYVATFSQNTRRPKLNPHLPLPHTAASVVPFRPRAPPETLSRATRVIRRWATPLRVCQHLSPSLSLTHSLDDDDERDVQPATPTHTTRSSAAECAGVPRGQGGADEGGAGSGGLVTVEECVATRAGLKTLREA